MAGEAKLTPGEANARYRPFFAWGLAAVALFLSTAVRGGVASAADRRGGYLVIIGGGQRPMSVTKRFVDLAGGAAAARLVVISLASEDSVGSGLSAVEELKA